MFARMLGIQHDARAFHIVRAFYGSLTGSRCIEVEQGFKDCSIMGQWLWNYSQNVLFAFARKPKTVHAVKHTSCNILLFAVPTPEVDCSNEIITAKFLRSVEPRLMDDYLNVTENNYDVNCDFTSTMDVNYVSISIPFTSCNTQREVGLMYLSWTSKASLPSAYCWSILHPVHSLIEISCSVCAGLTINNGHAGGNMLSPFYDYLWILAKHVLKLLKWTSDSWNICGHGFTQGTARPSTDNNFLRIPSAL